MKERGLSFKYYLNLTILPLYSIILMSALIPPAMAAPYNYSPYFPATGSNYVSVPDDPSLRLQQFSVAAWFKTNMTNISAVAMIVNKGGFGSDGSTVPDMNYGIWLTPSQQIEGGFESTNGANVFVATEASIYNDGAWHYAVLTYDQSLLKLYIDGVLKSSLRTSIIPDYNWNKPLTIGKNSYDNSRYFIGEIDEVMIYNRALTAQEVSDAYNGIFSNNGLLLHITFNNYISDFNVSAVGDFGCTINTSKVVNAIASTDPELVIGLGDYSYANSPSCWYDKIAIIEDKITLVMGNHETPDRSSSHLDSNGRADLLNRFNITQTYYSFDYNNIHFLVLDTESPYDINSEQYSFAINDLERASNSTTIDWIIVALHKPLYISPTIHPALTSFRNTYQPLFDQYGVDLVLQGHNHLYERSKPLKYDSIITSSQTKDYQDYEGEIYITIGTGGTSLYSFKSKAHYSIKQIVKYGFLEINMQNNGSTLVVKFYDTNMNINDSFTITKVRALV